MSDSAEDTGSEEVNSGCMSLCSSCDGCNRGDSCDCDGTECSCERCSTCGDVFDNDECGCGCRQCDSRCGDCCGHSICDNCSQCSEYGNCECFFCDSCCEVMDSDDSCGCGCGCNACENCCSHNRCNNCGGCSDSDSYCDGCAADEESEDDEERGERASGYRDGTVFQKHPLTFHGSTFPRNRKRNKLARYLSAEIEVARSAEVTATAETCRYWRSTVVTDGSLPQGGYEINTAPARGDAFLDEIAAITAALRTDKAGVTNACGLHVHVDARDMKAYQLRNLVRLYAALEPLLFGVVAPSRSSSSYSKPCAAEFLMTFAGKKDKHGIKKDIAETCYGVGTLDNKAHAFKHYRLSHYGEGTRRYYALNLHSYFFRGTVEFRMHHGTTDREKITNWALLCGWIVECAATATDKRIAAICAIVSERQPIVTGLTALAQFAPRNVVDWARSRAANFDVLEVM